jgi:septal ring factor EnvC (AmiA/AmiB activator)
MPSPQEQALIDDLAAVKTKQEKTASEIIALQASSNVLQQTVATLEAALAEAQANGTPSQALVDAVAAVKAQAQVVDDLIPDAS